MVATTHLPLCTASLTSATVISTAGVDQGRGSGRTDLVALPRADLSDDVGAAHHGVQKTVCERRTELRQHQPSLTHSRERHVHVLRKVGERRTGRRCPDGDDVVADRVELVVADLVVQLVQDEGAVRVVDRRVARLQVMRSSRVRARLDEEREGAREEEEGRTRMSCGTCSSLSLVLAARSRKRR